MRSIAAKAQRRRPRIVENCRHAPRALRRPRSRARPAPRTSGSPGSPSGSRWSRAGSAPRSPRPPSDCRTRSPPPSDQEGWRPWRARRIIGGVSHQHMPTGARGCEQSRRHRRHPGRIQPRAHRARLQFGQRFFQRPLRRRAIASVEHARARPRLLQRGQGRETPSSTRAPRRARSAPQSTRAAARHGRSVSPCPRFGG